MAAKVVSVATPHEFCQDLASGRYFPTSFWVGKELTVDTFSLNFRGLESLDRCQQLPEGGQYIAKARWRRSARSRKKTPARSRAECCVAHFRRSSSLWFWTSKEDLYRIFRSVFLTWAQVFLSSVDLHRPAEPSRGSPPLAVFLRQRVACDDFSGIVNLYVTNFCWVHHSDSFLVAISFVICDSESLCSLLVRRGRVARCLVVNFCFTISAAQRGVCCCTWHQQSLMEVHVCSMWISFLRAELWMPRRILPLWNCWWGA